MTASESQISGQTHIAKANRLGTAVEWLLLTLVFISYTRLSDVLIAEYALPSIAEITIALLVIVLALRWFSQQPADEPARLSIPILVFVIYGLLAFASLLYARDTGRAAQAVENYAKDALIAVLVILSLRRAATLRLVVWSLLAAGLLMAAIGLYQQATGNFAQSILGLGQANLQQIVGQTIGYRIVGPVGDPNFFAQIMLVLVPLALDRLLHEKHIVLRSIAAVALVTSLLTLVFTFSRGAFVGLLAVFVAMLICYRPRPVTILLALLLLIPLMNRVPKAYVQRLETIANVLPWSNEIPRELALRGRLSELKVGWLMFQDHPFAGVGLNNYPVYYLEYAKPIGLDPRLEARSAHNLYLEVAAETGLAGLLIFGAILAFTFRGLLRAPSRFRQMGLDDPADITRALTIGLVGYLVAATFLHAAYPRYMWLLLGIALAIPNVVRHERQGRET
jgi:putative inorganic carbon (HCO3(-)) transporter